MRRPTRIFERNYLVVEFLPLRAKHMRARDNDVNLLRACRDGAPNFRNAILERGKSRRKSGRNRGDINFRAFERAPRRFHKQVIDADSTNLNVEVRDSEFLDKFV